MKMLKDLVYNLYNNYLMLKTSALDIVKGKPSVILIGEIHTDPYHPKIEARIIKKYKPKFVLVEAPGMSEESQKILNGFVSDLKFYRDCVSKISLKYIGRKYGLDVEALFKSYGNETHLLDKPLSELEPEERFAIGVYTLRIEVNVLLEDLDASEKTQNILEITKSNVEKIERIEKVRKCINAIWAYKDKLPIFEAIREVGATLAGCDVDFSKAPRLNNNIKDPTEYLKKLMEFATSPGREYTMARLIKKYIEKTEEPIVAILGERHLKKGSKLLEELKKSGINYKKIKLPEIEKSEVSNRLYTLYLIDVFSNE